jgi:hypothetical protein
MVVYLSSKVTLIIVLTICFNEWQHDQHAILVAILAHSLNLDSFAHFRYLCINQWAHERLAGGPRDVNIDTTANICLQKCMYLGIHACACYVRMGMWNHAWERAIASPKHTIAKGKGVSIYKSHVRVAVCTTNNQSYKISIIVAL